MSKLIISVSGLRGVVGDSLTPEVAIRYVAAYAATLPAGPVVVTRDGRHTGPMLARAVQSALMAMGRRCLDGGIAATPTTGVLVRHHGAVGGIQISASHNPPEYNGLKLFDRTGRVIPTAPGQLVIDRYHEQSPYWMPFDRLGELRPIEDTTIAHLAMIASICDIERIKQRRFRVLLDANNGSGSVLGVPLLEELGCQVTVLGAEPDGHFGHPPEPTAENLEVVLPLIRESEADIGFCQDPDADRLAIIDERGRYLGEEYTLAMCVDHVLRSTPGPVVTNCSTSRMTQDLAEKYGVPFFRSAVGEANVVDLMLAEQAIIGGEGNGGAIDPRVGLVRDSFVGMALLLDAMASREQPISALAAELPSYAIHKSKIDLPAEKVASALDALENHFADAAPDRLDGLRLDWPNKWLLIRASNTEPIVRVVAEAPTETEAAELGSEASRALTNL
ncbi:MAG: phosphoglucosamine mutase [Planctomycetales bacterium]|nr:phosphoglucosamine mutase [Planctomycetales bacterium]